MALRFDPSFMNSITPGLDNLGAAVIRALDRRTSRKDAADLAAAEAARRQQEAQQAQQYALELQGARDSASMEREQAGNSGAFARNLVSQLGATARTGITGFTGALREGLRGMSRPSTTRAPDPLAQQRFAETVRRNVVTELDKDPRYAPLKAKGLERNPALSGIPQEQLDALQTSYDQELSKRVTERLGQGSGSVDGQRTGAAPAAPAAAPLATQAGPSSDPLMAAYRRKFGDANYASAVQRAGGEAQLLELLRKSNPGK